MAENNIRYNIKARFEGASVSFAGAEILEGQSGEHIGDADYPGLFLTDRAGPGLVIASGAQLLTSLWAFLVYCSFSDRAINPNCAHRRKVHWQRNMRRGDRLLTLNGAKPNRSGLFNGPFYSDNSGSDLEVETPMAERNEL